MMRWRPGTRLRSREGGPPNPNQHSTSTRASRIIRSMNSPSPILLASLLTLAPGQFPGPATDTKPAAASEQTAVLAGGCFWGVEAVFERLAGVKDVVSGFAGGARAASYEVVSTGTTGHAEVVKITYDPAQISYGTLLKVFFAVAHDPTQLNRQGPDEGPQYRSSILYTDDEQKALAEAYIRQLDAARRLPAPHRHHGRGVRQVLRRRTRAPELRRAQSGESVRRPQRPAQGRASREGISAAAEAAAVNRSNREPRPATRDQRTATSLLTPAKEPSTLSPYWIRRERCVCSGHSSESSRR